MSLYAPPLPTPSRLAARVAVLTSLALLAACTSPGHRAPVEDRKAPPRTSGTPLAVAPTPVSPASPASAAAAADAAPVKPPLPGAENAGKPGYYTVKPGDTLIRIGLDNGQPWRDIARWSGLENANLIEVGQVLRVVPPVADASGTSSRPVAVAGRVDSRPLDGRPAAAPASAAASAPVAVAREGDEEPIWAWPAAGAVATGFVEGKSPGLDIVGKAGDAVLAAADGRVIFTGAHRGYGNLIIIKHDATYLSAYAHNQALLVKEDQAVRKGQKIAEMGSSDAERVQLHFEVRRLGKPVDPARVLPAR